MHQLLNAEIIAKLNESGLTVPGSSTFKYTLYIKIEDEPLLQTNSWREVLNYLLECSDFMKEGQKFYNRHREGLWNEDDCLAFIEENAADIAFWSSYEIKEIKS